jgi:hypothetical protein
MKTVQVICFVFATAVATDLLPAASGYAKDLELQNQNHVGHCIGAGNCRPGHTGTAQPVAGHRAAGGTHGAGSPVSGGHSGQKR